jgi:hypothetical protein
VSSLCSWHSQQRRSSRVPCRSSRQPDHAPLPETQEDMRRVLLCPSHLWRPVACTHYPLPTTHCAHPTPCTVPTLPRRHTQISDVVHPLHPHRVYLELIYLLNSLRLCTYLVIYHMSLLPVNTKQNKTKECQQTASTRKCTKCTK